jgi:hypothetical protein
MLTSLLDSVISERICSLKGKLFGMPGSFFFFSELQKISNRKLRYLSAHTSMKMWILFHVLLVLLLGLPRLMLDFGAMSSGCPVRRLCK